MPRQPSSLPRSPGARGPRSPDDPTKDRELTAKDPDVKEEKPRVERDNRDRPVNKYRQQPQQQQHQQPVIGWDRRDQPRWNEYGYVSIIK